MALKVPTLAQCALRMCQMWNNSSHYTKYGTHNVHYGYYRETKQHITPNVAHCVCGTIIHANFGTFMFMPALIICVYVIHVYTN